MDIINATIKIQTNLTTITTHKTKLITTHYKTITKLPTITSIEPITIAFTIAITTARPLNHHTARPPAVTQYIDSPPHQPAQIKWVMDPKQVYYEY